MGSFNYNITALKRRFISSNETIVHAWSHPTGKPNFGDELFYEIVVRIVGINVRRGDHNESTFYPGGSVLHLINEGDVAWGVGLNNPKFHARKIKPHKVFIAGVRGPITQSFVNSSLCMGRPEIIGDPAVLLPRLFPEYRKKTATYKFGIVKHFNDKSIIPESDEILVIDPLRSPKNVILDILRCDVIISSSLHGLIVAEAYGIKAIWYVSDSLKEPCFKYYDYYLSTGRAPICFGSIVDAINSNYNGGGVEFNTDKLIDSFPMEIFA